MEFREIFRKNNQCRELTRAAAAVVSFRFASACLLTILSCWAVLLVGCGTTKNITATEQLLLSDAVDSTITKIDFRPLGFRKIYLETRYTEEAGKSRQSGATNQALVNADYVISAVRQQMVAAGCMLVEKKEDAELIVELRTGALGSDAHSVIYGLPATNIGNATGLIAGAPVIPTIPELAVAKRDMRSAAAKVALFAYNRETLEPYWQSGIAQAGSNARDSFFLGIGPFQSGTIYAAPRFAGRRMVAGLNFMRKKTPATVAQPINGVDHRSEYVFQPGEELGEEQIVAPEIAGEAKSTIQR